MLGTFTRNSCLALRRHFELIKNMYFKNVNRDLQNRQKYYKFILFFVNYVTKSWKANTAKTSSEVTKFEQRFLSEFSAGYSIVFLKCSCMYNVRRKRYCYLC